MRTRLIMDAPPRGTDEQPPMDIGAFRWLARFCAAVLASSAAAVLLAVLSVPFLLHLGGLPSGQGQTPSTAAAAVRHIIASIPFTLQLGATLALPASLFMGAAMVSLSIWRRRYAGRRYWAVAGATGAVPAMALLAISSPSLSQKLGFALWLAIIGISSAMAFRWVWFRRPRR